MIQVEEISDFYCVYPGAASCSEAFQWKVAVLLSCHLVFCRNEIAVSLQIVIFQWVFLIVHLYKTFKSADWYRHRSILITTVLTVGFFFFGDLFVPSRGFTYTFWFRHSFR